MAGLGLMHPGFLAAAAAVAVPVLIHLLLRPKARRMEIGSLRFLQLAVRESRRRRKVRRWLLLLLRAAAVLLLALLFARPYLKADADGREREVVLLIDQSASMAAAPSGKPLFAVARQAAEKVLRDLPEQTIVRVGYFDAGGVSAVPEGRLDGSRKAGFAGTDFGQALNWARDRVVGSARRQRQVYLFTDLQRCGLAGQAFEGWPPDVPLEVVEVGRPLASNLAVENAEVLQTDLRPKTPVLVIASVVNAGPLPVSGVGVRLSLEGPGGKQQQVQTVSPGPASRSQVRFSLPIEKPGLYTGFVEVEAEDAFGLDNRRWLAFEARRPDGLLLVDGRPGSTVFANETYYLEAALRLRLPDKDSPRTPYEPERLDWEPGKTLPELGEFRAVVLCDVAELPERDVARLRAFVSGGGGLLVFTGPNVRPETYEPLRQAGLFPAAVEGTAGPDDFRPDRWEKDHPILRPLSDPQHGDLRRIAFGQITKLSPAPGARVLAFAQGGEPLLIEGRLDSGTVLVLASTASRTWTDWPKTRLYVPLVHQMAAYLTERLPETQRVRQAPAGPGTDNPPGIETKGRTLLVHNLDPAESAIERLSVREFREHFHLPEAADRLAGRQAGAGVEEGKGGERPDELWVCVVWGLLGVLLIEFLLAGRTPA
jgi:hypothetical protein